MWVVSSATTIILNKYCTGTILMVTSILEKCAHMKEPRTQIMLIVTVFTSYLYEGAGLFLTGTSQYYVHTSTVQVVEWTSATFVFVTYMYLQLYPDEDHRHHIIAYYGGESCDSTHNRHGRQHLGKAQVLLTVIEMISGSNPTIRTTIISVPVN